MEALGRRAVSYERGTPLSSHIPTLAYLSSGQRVNYDPAHFPDSDFCPTVQWGNPYSIPSIQHEP